MKVIASPANQGGRLGPGPPAQAERMSSWNGEIVSGDISDISHTNIERTASSSASTPDTT